MLTTSIFLAKAFGLYMFIVSLAMLLNPVGFKSMMHDFVETPAAMTAGTILALVLGIILVLIHNLWVPDWRLLITLLAWLTLLKGVLRIFIPQASVTMVQRCETSGFYYGSAIISLIVGLFLLYKGFF